MRLLHPTVLVVGFAMILLAACAGTTGVGGQLDGQIPRPWEGRLAVRLLDSESERAGASWSAHFVLRGDARTGSLLLTTPVGVGMAEAGWTEHGAWLNTQGTASRYPDLAALTQALLGIAVPLEPLFALLQGRDAALPADWEVERANAPGGQTPRHLQLTHQAQPRAQLRLVLEP